MEATELHYRELLRLVALRRTSPPSSPLRITPMTYISHFIFITFFLLSSVSRYSYARAFFYVEFFPVYHNKTQLAL